MPGSDDLAVARMCRKIAGSRSRGCSLAIIGAPNRRRETGVDDLGISGHRPGTAQAMCDEHCRLRMAKVAEGAFRKRLAAETED